MDLYPEFTGLRTALTDSGVLTIVIDNPGRANALDSRTHNDLSRIWRRADDDRAVRSVLVTGSGETFSAGGDLDWVQDLAQDFASRAAGLREARELVANLVNCSKPVVSGVRGVAVGAGLAVALLADISVVAANARLIDGHTRIGVAAGDHAVLSWPLACGLPKAKYHLLTGEPLNGTDAERMGLISLAVDDAEVLPKATEIAERLAAGSATAVRWTKYALNSWLRAAMPHFDASLALEFLGFSGPDVIEGLDAIRRREPAEFNGPADDPGIQ
jgi:enoyl-CoA hydratase